MKWTCLECNGFLRVWDPGAHDNTPWSACSRCNRTGEIEVIDPKSKLDAYEAVKAALEAVQYQGFDEINMATFEGAMEALAEWALDARIITDGTAFSEAAGQLWAARNPNVP